MEPHYVVLMHWNLSHFVNEALGLSVYLNFMLNRNVLNHLPYVLFTSQSVACLDLTEQTSHT